MKRYRLALGLLAAALAVFVGLVPPARRDADAARQEFAEAREERERLRVRLADLSRRTTGDEGATAADGVTAARALRLAFLRATEGLDLTGVEIGVSPVSRGTMAARGLFAAEGPYVDVLRLARRLAKPSSGLLLERVSLGEARSAVRLDAEAFILQEAR